MATLTVSDLDPCVKQIICGLSAATLRALNELLASYKAFIAAQLTVIESELLAYDMIAGPIELGNTYAQQALAEAKAGIGLIPTTLAVPCVQLNIVTTALTRTVDELSQDVLLLSRRLERLLSYGEELELIKQELASALNILDVISLQISLCGALA